MKVKVLCNKSRTSLFVIDHAITISRKMSFVSLDRITGLFSSQRHKIRLETNSEAHSHIAWISLSGRGLKCLTLVP